MQQLKLGDQIELKVNRLGINGEGIGYINRLAVFIDGALPDETIKAEIKDVQKTYARAELISITDKSPYRREPFCPYYEKCGGCQLQHLKIDQIMVYKKDIILQALRRYVKTAVDEKIIKEMIPSPQDTHYRNKASLPLRQHKNKNHFGMYMKNSNIFLPIDDCPVQDEKINQMLRTLTHLMDQYKIKAYDPKRNDGHLSTAIIRISDDKKQAQASLLVVNAHPKLKQMIDQWVKKEPLITSVFTYQDDPRKKQAFFEGEKIHIKGSETLPVKLGGHRFLLRPEAFFQLNYGQAHQFYEVMRKLADLKPTDVVVDAYSGVAPVSFYIHDLVKKIYAIEIDHEANISAQLSLEREGIHNVQLLEGDFFKVLKGLKKLVPDVMFFDPPRTGLGDATIEVILKMKPKKIIYGSCNPSTLAKDLHMLLEHYDLKEIVPLDMFPYTAHVETISLLSLKAS